MRSGHSPRGLRRLSGDDRSRPRRRRVLRGHAEPLPPIFRRPGVRAAGDAAGRGARLAGQPGRRAQRGTTARAAAAAARLGRGLARTAGGTRRLFQRSFRAAAGAHPGAQRTDQADAPHGRRLGPRRPRRAHVLSRRGGGAAERRSRAARPEGGRHARAHQGDERRSRPAPEIRFLVASPPNAARRLSGRSAGLGADRGRPTEYDGFWRGSPPRASSRSTSGR